MVAISRLVILYFFNLYQKEKRKINKTDWATMIGRSLTRKQASRFRAGYASENRPFTVKYSQLKKTKQKSKQKETVGNQNIPLTSKFNLRQRSRRSPEITFFLTVDRRIRKVGSSRSRSRGRSSIFPVDERSAVVKTGFFLSLYSSSRRLRNGSVTPVRRREDTEGDGDAGVEVQIG